MNFFIWVSVVIALAGNASVQENLSLAADRAPKVVAPAVSGHDHGPLDPCENEADCTLARIRVRQKCQDCFFDPNAH